LRKKNNWKETNLDTTLDFCEISKGAKHPIISTFIPGVAKQLETMMHPCPYVVRLKNRIIFFDKEIQIHHFFVLGYFCFARFGDNAGYSTSF
jgi:hypothetical protein